MEKRVREIIYPAVVYVALITLIMWFLVLQETTIPLSVLGFSTRINPSFLGTPLISFITFKFLSVISERLLVGRLTEPLSSGFNNLSYTSFIYFIADWSYIPQWIKPLTMFLFFSTILSLLSKTLTEYLKSINPIFEPILSSIYILFIGFIGSQTWLNIYPYLENGIVNSPLASTLMPYFRAGLADPINNVIVLSTAITSVLGLTGIVRNHPNSYFRWLGRKIGARIEQVSILNFLLIYYLFFVRKFLVQLSGINPQYIVILEWLVICGFFYIGYRGIKNYAEESLVQDDLHGTWKTHLQQVSLQSDPRLDHLSDLIERFVMSGDKNELLIHVILILQKGDMSPAFITQAVSPMIDYRDVPVPRLGFIWQSDYISSLNQKRRRRVINTVLSSIQLKPDVNELNQEEQLEEVI